MSPSRPSAPARPKDGAPGLSSPRAHKRAIAPAAAPPARSEGTSSSPRLAARRLKPAGVAAPKPPSGERQGLRLCLGAHMHRHMHMRMHMHIEHALARQCSMGAYLSVRWPPIVVSGPACRLPVAPTQGLMYAHQCTFPVFLFSLLLWLQPAQMRRRTRHPWKTSSPPPRPPCRPPWLGRSPVPPTSCKKARPGTRRPRHPLPLHPTVLSGAKGSRPPRRCLRRGLLLSLLLQAGPTIGSPTFASGTSRLPLPSHAVVVTDARSSGGFVVVHDFRCER